MREVLLYNSINLLKRKLRPNERERPDQGLKDSKSDLPGQEPSSSPTGRISGKCVLGPRVRCRDQVRRKKVGREPYTPCCNFTHDLYTARDNRRESTPVPVSVSIP